MGPVTPFIPMIMTAVGSLIQMNAADKAASQQRSAINQANAIATEQADKARSQILTNAQQYDPARREQESSTIQKAIESRLNEGQTTASPMPVSSLGATSDAYTGAAGKETQRIGDRAGRLDTLFSKTLTPGRLARQEGASDMSTAEQANSLFSNARNAMNAGQQDAAMIQPSGGTNLVGRLLTGAGGALGSSGGIDMLKKFPTLFGGAGTVPGVSQGRGSVPVPFALPQE